MKSRKRKLLEKTYDALIKAALQNGPLSDVRPYIDDDFMGYGSALDEKLIGWSKVKWMIERQREELNGQEASIKRFPVHTIISKDDCSALIVEEIEITVQVDGEINGFTLRLSTLLEYVNDRWMIRHFHGSTADADTPEGKAWPIEEWKRRNAELQRAVDVKTEELNNRNKELQIEAALERVRAASIAMHKSDQLNDVVSELYQQIKSLNFPDWGCTIIICQKDTGILEHWYAEENQNMSRQSYNVSSTGHEVSRKQWKMWKAKDPEFTIELKGKEKQDYTEFMLSETDHKHLPEEVKAGWRAPEEIYFHYISMGCGLLEFVNVAPFESDNFPVYRQFAKVFEQSYTRFLDLQKAEAQAREAQIEASLERVRAQTMAMHNSDDIGKCILQMFSELTALGVDKSTRFGIGILNHTNENNQVWTALKEGEEYKMYIGNLDMNLHPLLKSARKAWKEGLSIHKYLLEGEDLLNYYKVMNDAPDYPLYLEINKIPERQFHYGFVFDHGFFYAFCPQEFPPELIRITQRFSSQFAQTYRRYLDLVRAEEQAREANIEASLERVRSRSMAMHHSDELSDVAAVLFTEAESLTGLDIDRCYICIPDEETDTVSIWYTNEKGQSEGDSWSSAIDGHPVVRSLFECWKNQVRLEMTMQKEALKDWVRYAIKHGFKLPQNEEARDIMYSFGAPFKQGVIVLMYVREASEDNKNVVARLAQNFQQTYTRFLDLQKAEAQARESQIEAALEKVRSSAMAMRKSEDLELCTKIVFEELEKLDLKIQRSGIGIFDAETKDCSLWTTVMNTEGDKELSTGITSMTIHPMLIKTFDAWLAQETVSYVFEGEDLKSYYEIISDGHFHLSEDVIDSSSSLPKEYYYYTPFVAGGLYFFTDTQPLESDKEVLNLFAEVFNLTYTRFLDLQIAEEQSLLIKQEKERLEQTLTELKATQSQLVQAEKMASLGELTAGIAHEIQNPLNFVNNFSEVSGELVQEALEELESGDKEEALDILNDLKSNLDKINHHGDRASSIVKGMLDHSRESSGEKVETDINALCDEYVRLSYHGLKAKDKTFNAQFDVHFQEELPLIEVVPQDIGRVLLNILNNAFYTVDKKAKMNSNGEYHPEVNIQTELINNKIKIQISDNGQGMTDETKDKVFQPFYTTKPTGQGTGLGMSISYDIVTKGHGGELTVESEVGEGSRFVIELPIRE